jgi:N-methylhydantoinase A
VAATTDQEYVVAVDSGGTFSDCVVIDRDGRVETGKAPSTPPDYSVGVLDAVGSAAERLDLSREQLLERSVLFAHGTTVATNALLTRTGSRTGFLTTRGHEDVLSIGRTSQKVAGLSEAELMQVSRLRKPDPIVPRELVEGVDERVDAHGEVVVPLNEESLERAVNRLLARGADSLAVCFLWSFLNPAHERAALRFLEEHHPDLPISVSSQLAPVLKEYERGITVAINAYLVRRTGSYLRVLLERLGESGYCRDAVVMQSSGGVTSMARARTRAVSLLVSGPAGGVMAAKATADLLGHSHVITTDVGGTSFDVGLIVGGEPQFSESPILAGFQLVAPMIDVATIGAGGGSIAWIEPGTELLRVGPQSAGADPGPVSYLRGGTEPTVTDADLVLGRLNPRFFLGGRAALDREAAARAIEERIARPLEMSVEEAALAIVRIVDAHMSDLVRRVSVERGFDPRRFIIYAFGGAGPGHVGAYGAGLGAAGAVVPAIASEFSAFGIAGSDILAVADASEPASAPFDVERLKDLFEGLERRAAGDLAVNGVPADRMVFRRYALLRYHGQVHELRTPVPDLNGSDAPLIEAFERLYEEKFGAGAAYREAGIQAMTYMVHGYGTLSHPALKEAPPGGDDASAALVERRAVVFPDELEVETPVYRAERLRPGNVVQGPAVVEALTTTTVIHPGQSASVDRYRNLTLSLGKGGPQQ